MFRNHLISISATLKRSTGLVRLKRKQDWRWKAALERGAQLNQLSARYASLQNNFCLTHQTSVLQRLTLAFELTGLPFFTQPVFPPSAEGSSFPRGILWTSYRHCVSILSSQLNSPAPRLKLWNCASKLTARLEFEQEKVPGFQLHLHLFDNSYSRNTSDNNFYKSTGTARDPRS